MQIADLSDDALIALWSTLDVWHSDGKPRTADDLAYEWITILLVHRGYIHDYLLETWVKPKK